MPGAHSPGSRSNSFARSENISFPRLHSQSFSAGSLVRRSRWTFGRNRLDWIRLSQNVFASQSAWRQYPARTALGLVALAVVNYLGTATPHGAYWFPFFLVFAFAMTAMRVLICWLYLNTKSVLITQLMHISSTGSSVIFSPPAVSSRQEVIWYALYGTALWLAVLIVVKKFSTRLAT
jgi:hypothetical protein